MKLLLDTHTFLWWDSNPSNLSSEVLALCQNREHVILLSVVSVWEMQIKTQLGKLKLDLPLADTIKTQQQANHIQILPVTLAHVLALENLPMPHKDPFDRLLIAQAMVENSIVLSNDAIFERYPVKVIW